MAINYTTLFTNLGEFVQRVNQFTSLYATLDTYRAEIEGDLSTNGRYDVLSGVDLAFDGFKANILGWCSRMADKATQLLTHRDTVLEQLGLGDQADIQTVLADVVRNMTDNAQTVNRSTATIGALTSDKANANAGTVVTGKVLDGASRPGLGLNANPEYAGLNSELPLTSDTITLTCLLDSNLGAAEGAESWSLAGKPSVPSFHWQDRGSGNGNRLNTLHMHSILQNLDFEAFTANIPNSWTRDSGTAATHINSEATNKYHGATGLKFIGDGVQAAIQISQALTTGSVTPLRRYCVAAYVRGEALTLAGTLTIQFEGTGYTAGATEKIELNAAALAAQTTFDLESFFVNMPKQIPTDLKLVIKVTGTLTSAKNVYLDWMAFGPVTWHNGVHFVVVAGSDKFTKEDRFSFPVTNNDAGVFQKFFRDAYGIQLPSSATPSLADSLAT